jgi:anti-anti-sigma regulatory factor
VEEKEGGIFAEGGRLVVKRDLGFGQGLRLEGILKSIFASTDKEVVIDLSEVRHLCSSNLASLAAACNVIAHRGKTVKIIAPPSVARVLRLGGVERVATIEEINK